MNTIALDNKTYYEGKFYISPEVKALEVGVQCPNDLSDDYKNLKFRSNLRSPKGANFQ